MTLYFVLGNGYTAFKVDESSADWERLIQATALSSYNVFVKITIHLVKIFCPVSDS